MRMDHFRYLLEIDKQHSITKAAKSLFLSQNTLSSIVKGAEDELGFEIFVRAQRGVYCTPEGEEAMTLITDIQDLYQQMLNLDLVNVKANYIARILLSPSINSALAVPLSRKFTQVSPDGSLDFRQVPGLDVTNLLIKDEGNIGLTYLSNHTIDSFHTIATKYHLKVERLLTDRHYLLVSKDHPLAELDSISTKSLTNLSFALLSHYFKAEESRYLSSFGPGNQYTTYANIALIKQAVARENMVTVLTGYSIFLNTSASNDQFKAIELVEDRGPRTLNLCLIHREEDHLHPVEKVLLGCVKDYFCELQETNPLPEIPKFEEDFCEDANDLL